MAPRFRSARRRRLHAGWVLDWRFMATADSLHSPDFAQALQRLHLPREVVDKIYRVTRKRCFAELDPSPIAAFVARPSPLSIGSKGQGVTVTLQIRYAGLPGTPTAQ